MLNLLYFNSQIIYRNHLQSNHQLKITSLTKLLKVNFLIEIEKYFNQKNQLNFH